MARGWESKAIEELREERTPARSGPPPDPEEAARQRERASIELSRTRVLHDLEKAVNPRYQAILQEALQHLNDKLQRIR